MRSPAMSCTVERASHWADLMRLFGAVRRLAFEPNPPPSEALGGIRDAVHDYDH